MKGSFFRDNWHRRRSTLLLGHLGFEQNKMKRLALCSSNKDNAAIQDKCWKGEKSVRSVSQQHVAIAKATQFSTSFTCLPWIFFGCWVCIFGLLQYEERTDLFRTLLGDLSHLASIFILLHKIQTTRSCRGKFLSYPKSCHSQFCFCWLTGAFFLYRYIL